MKFPKKNIPLALAVVAAGIFTSAVAFAAPKPKATDMPVYMVHAANLDNAPYMACIKARVKAPGDLKILENFEAALGCQKEVLKI